MDRRWKSWGLLALLIGVPTLAHADFKDMGRGSAEMDGRGMACPTIDGRGVDLDLGRGYGRGSPVVMWDYSTQKDWTCGECGKDNEHWQDRCWGCNTKRWIAQPHDDI